MTIIDLKNPVFKILADHNMHVLEERTMKLSREGWYPIGEKGRKGNDWIQVMVKEGSNASNG